MKQTVTLPVVSLLTLILLTIHLTHDVILQAAGAVSYPIPVFVFALWLYGTLVLSDRVAGYIIMLLGGLFGAAMIVVHAKDLVVGKSGGFLFVWTQFALSTTGIVTTILSAHGLWTTLRSRRATHRVSASWSPATEQ
ncbi:MAG: hypothetical protein KJZ47_05615 [Gemmatimonadales bacterium]|nr:hypothetical protein [Gemmatimonadales bacterium]